MAQFPIKNAVFQGTIWGSPRILSPGLTFTAEADDYIAFGVDADAGFSGDLLNFSVDGALQFAITSSGTGFFAGDINLGHASDTTLSRASAGRLAVEGVNVLTQTSTDTGITNKTFSTLTTDRIILTGNISSTAWTTSGIRIRGVASTFTDTTSTGTVAAAYTNVYGGNTIAASNSVTFTNYITAFFNQPTAGTNVTFTNRWALGAESARFGTSNHLTITTGGVLTATNAALTTPTITGATIGTTAPTTSALASTAALSGDLLFHWLFNQQYTLMNWGQDGGNVTAGSGSVVGNVGGRIIQTGATAGSSAVIYANPVIDTTSYTTSSGQKINWAKTVIISFAANSGNPLTTNGTFRVCFGTLNANPTALDARGVGIVCTYASASTMNVALEVHDGTTLTTSATLATIDQTTVTNHRFTIVSASGTVYLFIDGAYINSSTGGPSNLGGSGIYHKCMVLNGADASNNSFGVSNFRIFVKP